MIFQNKFNLIFGLLLLLSLISVNAELYVNQPYVYDEILVNNISDGINILGDSKYCDYLKYEIINSTNTKIYCGNQTLASYFLEIYEYIVTGNETIENDTANCTSIEDNSQKKQCIRTNYKELRTKIKNNNNNNNKPDLLNKTNNKVKVKKDEEFLTNNINTQLYDIGNDQVKIYFNFSTEDTENEHIVCMNLSDTFTNENYQFNPTDPLYIGQINGDYCYGDIIGNFSIDPTFIGSDCTAIQSNITAGNDIELNDSITGYCPLNMTVSNRVFNGSGFTITNGGIRITGTNVTIINTVINGGYNKNGNISGIWVDNTTATIIFNNISVNQTSNGDQNNSRGITSLTLVGTTNNTITDNIISNFLNNGQVTCNIETFDGGIILAFSQNYIARNIIKNITGRTGGSLTGGCLATTQKVGSSVIGIMGGNHSIIENNSIYNLTGGTGGPSNDQDLRSGGYVYALLTGTFNITVRNNYINNILGGTGGFRNAPAVAGGTGGNANGILTITDINGSQVNISNNVISSIMGGQGNQSGSSTPGFAGESAGITSMMGQAAIFNNLIYNLTTGAGSTGSSTSPPGVARGIYLTTQAFNNTIFNNNISFLRPRGNSGTLNGCVLRGIDIFNGTAHNNIINDLDTLGLTSNNGCTAYAFRLSNPVIHYKNNISNINGTGAGMTFTGAFNGITLGDGIDEVKPETNDDRYFITNYIIKFYRSEAILDTTQISIQRNNSGALTPIVSGLATTFCGTAPSVNCTYNWSSPVNGSFIFINTTANRNASSNTSLEIGLQINDAQIDPYFQALDNQTLSGYCNAFEAQGSNITYNFIWYLNNTLFTNGSVSDNPQGVLTNINNISDTNTSVGQNWTFSCQASNGIFTTDYLNSSVTSIVSNISHLAIILEQGTNIANNSVISGALYNLSLNITAFDFNLSTMNINVSCELNGTIYYFTNSTTNISLTHTNTSIPIGQYPLQSCLMSVFVNDTLPNSNATSNITFYIGGAVNTTGINIYDNSSISNFSVVITTMNSYPGFNGTQNITGTQGYLANLSNGTYQLLFTSPQYFNQTANITIENSTQNQIFSSFQAVINMFVRNVLTQTNLTNASIQVHNNVTSRNTYANETTTVLQTFYLNASTYNLFIQRVGYQNKSTNFTLNYLDNITLPIDMSFFAIFNFFDERTLGVFNVSSADSIQFLVFCPNETVISVINQSNQSVPITCSYSKFKFILNYGVTSYYRTFILNPDELFNVNIYLINLLTTQSLFNTFIIDDLLDKYDNPRIFVKKNIGNKTVQITADFVDIEQKISAYLIESHEYIIEIQSDNQPTRVIGFYSADIAGNKNLRLYDINIDGSPSANAGFATTTWMNILNQSNSSIAVAVYNDSLNKTSDVTFNLYTNQYNGPLLYTATTSGSNIEFTFDVTNNLSSTIVGELLFTDINGNNKNTTHVYHKNLTIPLQILSSIGDTVEEGQLFLNWFFLLLIGALALYATRETANYATIGLVLLTVIFRIFGWFTIDIVYIVIAGLFGLINLFIREEKKTT